MRIQRYLKKKLAFLLSFKSLTAIVMLSKCLRFLKKMVGAGITGKEQGTQGGRTN